MVRDASGGVLPGVSVEASSPALIERVRTVVSDEQGRYRLADLRPGTYTVTFTLAGFAAIKREGIELTSGFTATVNADLKIGELEETVNVSGQSPLVDTQNIRQQAVVSAELLSSLPTGSKGLMSLARLVPGMSGGGDAGGANGLYSANAGHNVTLHGKDGLKTSYDGMATNNFGLSGALSYVMNPATVEETVVSTGGGTADTDVSGATINMIPKEGSNGVHLLSDVTYSNQNLQSENLDDTLRARGVTTPSKLLHLYDSNVTVGGPVRRDRVWFFAATRFSGTENQVPNNFFNATRGTPLYTPDLSQPAYRKEWLKSQAGRITWQVTPKNKLNFFADTQSYQVRGRGDNAAPEALPAVFSFWPVGLYQAIWNAPTTQKLLFEGGASVTRNDFTYSRQQSTDIFGFEVPATDPSIVEASTGYVYNAKSQYTDAYLQLRIMERFSVTYSTGSHLFKTGFQLQQHVVNWDYRVNSDGRNLQCPTCPVTYTFFQQRPVSLTQWATPYVLQARTKAELGLYAQDQWVLKRLTLNYGLRFDYFNGYVPAQHVDAVPYTGARDFQQVSDTPNWKDLSPRLGAAYDLFGKGRTAIKASLGRYLNRMGVNAALANNPISTSINNVTRTWTDANGNYVPDCNLRNPAPNGECGAISNVNFGNSNPSATRYADDIIHGFGNRAYFWDGSLEWQQQLGQRASTTFGYYRNWSNFFDVLGSGNWNSGVANNLAVTPADYDPYCVTAPTDPRLPNGGGYQVCGLYDLKPAKFGQGSIVIERPDNYGGQHRASDFFTLSFATRFSKDIQFGGSLDTGRTVTDNCFVVNSPQQRLNCHVVTPFSAQTQIRLYGSYALPKDIQVSATWVDVSGVEYQANLSVPNSVVAQSLGRNLAACGTATVCNATVTIPLISPQTQFEPRRRLLDLRTSKFVPLSHKMRLRLNVDVYNVLNSSAIVWPGINNTYGPRWRQPIAGGAGGGLVDARLVQFGGQLTF